MMLSIRGRLLVGASAGLRRFSQVVRSKADAIAYCDRHRFGANTSAAAFEAARPLVRRS